MVLGKKGFSVRLIRMGCKNRPFYQLGALPATRRSNLLPDEVIGNVDPIPNEHNEIIASVDLKRMAYWLGKGARLSRGAENVLGMAGFIPIPPRVYIRALENREKERESEMKEEEPKEESEEKSEEFYVEPVIATKKLV